MYCIICGKEIEEPIRISIYRACPLVPICGSEICINQYKTLKREWIPSNKKRTIDKFEGFCKYCGKPYILKPRKTDKYHHYYCSPISSNPPIKREKVKTPVKHPLKPWQDPDSLFCDAEFLRDLTGKEPAKGNECKDTNS